ncbi:UDP-3-O-acyl-N-acetylglucosamine deacetylase [Henriciella mobilis]|uniref:UDP-3-O-acyl-N-acetylglucosamine deacetylase n=1 Tax=Henriciella mobilis TaxID=2305467 RepID=UPI000E66EBAF|nr:UDP-3-O-acyl-N-acetylglucosamine deacetylase [Henriciella mobilis]RIJ15896.1 UDP-3-O-acyl-N-acetylglucosamine deacetylase [Henriciella mobilis]RIJ21106.1 UDP-3-O-acyl-N-acetylglucosamine deacetylase [Henriciella mobilis]
MSSVQVQQTVSCPVVCAGVGVHSGARARMVMKPAPVGTGIRFRRTDIKDRDNLLMARGDHVSEVQLGTTLQNADGVTVATVEHLLAACAGIGVDNLLIEIDGPEVPIMDGSSAVYCELLLSAGLRQQGALRRRIRILEEVEVGDGVKTARLKPSADNYLAIHAKIEFESRAIGTQQMSLRLLPGMFARDIAFARTFGFAHEVEFLKSKGLARGGSLDNAVVLDGDTVVNPEGLRASDEFVRHKILDAVGDLMLAGAPIAGIYEARQPGHALNNKLVRALLDTPSAWCWETDEVAADMEPVSLAARQ